MHLTTAYAKIKAMKSSTRIVQGGTSAGKTYNILIDWILQGINDAPEFRGINSIVSESLPHLKRGAMRDFFNILKQEGIYDRNDHNKSEHIYTIGNAMYEFFPADDDKKLRGGRRMNLFMNEANNMKKMAYDELEVRTRHTTWLDFNPVSEFWGHKLKGDFIKLTYLDNEELNERIIRSIEDRKGDGKSMWWKVYGMGEIGTVEGVILTNWEPIDKVPEDAELLCTGLDFGFANDPSCAIAMYRYDKEIIAEELFCDTGMSNRLIADQLGVYRTGTVYADSAEPKSISEIRKYGIPIHSVRKGKDSVRFGIDLLQQYKIRPTNDSVNLIKALRNYSWKGDGDGGYVNSPSHNFSDCIDALRYAAISRLGNKNAVYNVI